MSLERGGFHLAADNIRSGTRLNTSGQFYLTIIYCRDPSVPKGILEENGVKFRFKVYERTAVS